MNMIVCGFFWWFLSSAQAEENDSGFAQLQQQLTESWQKKDYAAAQQTLQKIQALISKEKDAARLKVKPEEEPEGQVDDVGDIVNELMVEGESILIHHGGGIVYLLKSNTRKRSHTPFSGQFIVGTQDSRAVENKYIRIGSKTKTIKYRSSHPAIATVSDKGHFTFQKTGDVVITVSVDNEKTEIPVRVLEIPLKPNMTKDQIIQKFGIADHTVKKYIEYNELERVDDIAYFGSIDEGLVEHWKYNMFPHAIFRFQGSKLQDCVLVEWISLKDDFFYYEEEY